MFHQETCVCWRCWVSLYRCDHNKYSIDYILALSQCKRKHAPPSDGEGEVEREGGDSDSVMEGVDELDSSDEDFMTNLMEKVT